MSAPDAAGVVVVAYANATTIDQCLDRLLAAKDVARVVVIDNASPDDTGARVSRYAAQDRRLSLVRNDRNTGFAAACNQGATAIAQPWIAFVNPDLYVEPDTFSRLLSHARTRAGAGLIGVGLVDERGVPDPASRREAPSLREFLRSALRGGGNLAMGRDPALSLQPVDALSGALMLMPSGLFARLGGFDEGYRLHAEDLDLCRRVRDAGYEVLVANDIDAVHVRGVSSRARPIWSEWQKHRGIWRYLRQHDEDCRRPGWAVVAVVAISLRFLLAAPMAWWRARMVQR